MTGVTSGGAFSGVGTGAAVTAPIGNFASLLALFSQIPAIFSTAQAGLPSEWWAYPFCGNNVNPFVAYAQPLSMSTSAWYSGVPGIFAGEPNCNLQGINVGE